MPNRVEILAPAGDEASLDAALRAGADAVYFGLQRFNARMRASNFAQPHLRATLDRIHSAGARGYVALNTLVFDHELDDLRAALAACGDAHVDAIIVQDLGVLSLARKLVPSIPVHASTQMTCTDERAVAWVAAMGVSRVILPRELSCRQVERVCASSPIELEVFVHGALCVSFSGQCLASLAMGGRSANRGACAQPCRLPYALEVDGAEQSTDAPYVLSPMDLDASPVVWQLLDAGVQALKIEGRLKGPAYVASAVRLYRGIVDAWRAGQRAPQAHEPQRQTALQMFSRGSGPGFLEGVNHQRLVEGRSSDHRGILAGTAGPPRAIGGRMHLSLALQVPLTTGDGVLIEGDARCEEIGGRVWSLLLDGLNVDAAEAGAQVDIWLGPDRPVPRAIRGRRVFRTSSPRVQAELETWLRQQQRRIGIRLQLRGRLEQHPVLSATSRDGRCAEVTLAQPLRPAQSRPLDPAVAREKLGRLGDTPFALEELVLDLPAASMLPWSVLNEGRRRLIDELLRAEPQQAWGVHRATRPCAEATPTNRAWAVPLPEGVAVVCRQEHHVEPALRAGADSLILDLPARKDAERAFSRLRARPEPKRQIGLATSHVCTPGEAGLDAVLLSLSPDRILVRSLGAFALFAHAASSPIVADASIHVANAPAARVLLDHGASACTPSWDVDPDMLALDDDPPLRDYVEAIAYGRRPLFHTQHCLYAARLSSGTSRRTCERPCDRHQIVLRDRVGARYVVAVDAACRNTIYEQAAVAWREQAARWVERGVRRLRVELVDEPDDVVEAVVGGVRNVLARGRGR